MSHVQYPSLFQVCSSICGHQILQHDSATYHPERRRSLLSEIQAQRCDSRPIRNRPYEISPPILLKHQALEGLASKNTCRQTALVATSACHHHWQKPCSYSEVWRRCIVGNCVAVVVGNRLGVLRVSNSASVISDLLGDPIQPMQ